MGSRTGSIMIISIQSESEKAIFDLYASISKSSYMGVHRISVDSRMILIHMSDNSLTEQKIIINEVKQFMRDNEVKYTMEIK